MSDINVNGTILNLISIGISTLAAICEFIDNSIAFRNTRVNIKIKLDNDNNFIYVDDGLGMDREELRKAHIISERSESNSSKQGRFGCGDKCAKGRLTNFEYPTLTISKKNINTNAKDKGISQIEIDWPICIKENKYLNVASGLAIENSDTWTDNAKDYECGTLQSFKCNDKIADELRKKITSFEITESYLYELGVTYCDYMKKNEIGYITLEIDGKEFTVIAIDPLEWEKIPEENKQLTTIEIWKKESKYSFMLNINGERGLYGYNGNRSKWWSVKDLESLKEQIKAGVEESELKIKSKKIKNYPKENNFMEEGYEYLTSMSHRVAYATDEDWLKYQSYIYQHIGKQIKNSNGKKCQNTFAHMSGKFISRDDKIVARIPTVQRNQGDTNKYEYYDNLRSNTKFHATDETDKLFNVLINKSKLDENLISPEILKTIKKIEDDFALNQFLLKNPKPERKKPEAKKSKSIPPKVCVNLEIEEEEEEDCESSESSVNESLKEEDPISESSENPVNNVNFTIEDSEEEDSISESSERTANNIDFTIEDSEEEDSISESSESADTINENNNNTINENKFEAKTVSVGPKKDTKITIRMGMNIIEKWYNSKQKTIEFNVLIDEMIIKYLEKCAPDQIRIIYRYLSLEQKYLALMDCIKDRYKYECDYETKDLWFGAELFRSYYSAFPNPI